MVLTFNQDSFPVQVVTQVVSLVMAVLQLIVSHVQAMNSFIKGLATLPAHPLSILTPLFEPASPVIISAILVVDQLQINVSAVSRRR